MPEATRNVLIMDEDGDSLMKLFDLVYSRGFDPTGVSTEKEALSWLARRPAAILIDHGRRPERSSDPFVKRVLALSPATKIIRLKDSADRAGGSMPAAGAGPLGGIGEPGEKSQLLESLIRALENQPQEDPRRDTLPLAAV